MGPVNSQVQLDKIMGFIEKGKKSAELVCGGNKLDRDGFFVEPTIFTNVTNDMEIAKDEIFGPVTSVFRYSDLDEAIAIANDTPYGLAGAVFSTDQKKCHRVVQNMECGGVTVNNYFSIFYDTPFGGYKQSGVGRELGDEGLESFLESKTVVYDCD